MIIILKIIDPLSFLHSSIRFSSRVGAINLIPLGKKSVETDLAFFIFWISVAASLSRCFLSYSPTRSLLPPPHITLSHFQASKLPSNFLSWISRLRFVVWEISCCNKRKADEMKCEMSGRRRSGRAVDRGGRGVVVRRKLHMQLWDFSVARFIYYDYLFCFSCHRCCCWCWCCSQLARRSSSSTTHVCATVCVCTRVSASVCVAGRLISFVQVCLPLRHFFAFFFLFLFLCFFCFVTIFCVCHTHTHTQQKFNKPRARMPRLCSPAAHFSGLFAAFCLQRQK